MIGIRRPTKVRRIKCSAALDLLMVAVDLLGKPKHLTDSECRVEVVVHCRIEVVQERLCLRSQPCRRVRRACTLRELCNDCIRVAQTVECRLCLMQPLVAEVKWAAVMCL